MDCGQVCSEWRLALVAVELTVWIVYNLVGDSTTPPHLAVAGQDKLLSVWCSVGDLAGDGQYCYKL